VSRIGEGFKGVLFQSLRNIIIIINDNDDEDNIGTVHACGLVSIVIACVMESGV
jgi:hypothetical protein